MKRPSKQPRQIFVDSTWIGSYDWVGDLSEDSLGGDEYYSFPKERMLTLAVRTNEHSMSILRRGTSRVLIAQFSFTSKKIIARLSTTLESPFFFGKPLVFASQTDAVTPGE
jgi:hypothetical protein